MRISRLLQARNPLFWLMLVLNAMSVALVWIVHHRALDAWATLLVGGFALCNALIGSWLIWRLLRDEAGADSSS
jgi:hypothetical protein